MRRQASPALGLERSPGQGRRRLLRGRMKAIETIQAQLLSAETVALVRGVPADALTPGGALAGHVCEKLDLYDAQGEPS